MDSGKDAGKWLEGVPGGFAYPCLQDISLALRPLWNVPPAEVLPALEGRDPSKGQQSGLAGASVSPTGDQDWQVRTRYQTH